MNQFPKKPSAPSDSEEEEHVWDELPAPPSFDVEEDWSKGGKKPARRIHVVSGDHAGDDVSPRVRRIEGAVTRLDIQPSSPLPPDARLSADDLRPENAPGGPLRRRFYVRETKRQGSVRWVFYAGLGVMAMIVAAFGLVMVLNESNPKVNPLGVPPLVIEQEEEYPRGEHIADLLARKEEAIDLFGRFLRAETDVELLGLVRPVPGIDTLVRNPRRPEGLPPDWKVTMDSQWDVHTEQDPVFGVLSGYYPDEGKFHAFFTLENGRLLVDWKATVGHGSVPFSRLTKGEGDASEVRVWVEPATFYSAAFPESEYRSYKIHTSVDDPAVWVFARRGTVPDVRLAQLFHKSMFGGDRIKPSMVLLSLARGSSDAAPNQWLITDLLHTAWVLP